MKMNKEIACTFDFPLFRRQEKERILVTGFGNVVPCRKELKEFLSHYRSALQGLFVGGGHLCPEKAATEQSITVSFPRDRTTGCICLLCAFKNVQHFVHLKQLKGENSFRLVSEFVCKSSLT